MIPLENNVGKGENAGIQHFLLVPQCFLPYKGEVSKFWPPSICRLQMIPIWKKV